jgi:hypothetical protein
MNGPKSDGCLNYTGGISKEPQSVGNKRKTARRKWSRRAVLNSSRGNQTRLELFGQGVVELQTSQPDICGHVVAVLA